MPPVNRPESFTSFFNTMLSAVSQRARSMASSTAETAQSAASYAYNAAQQTVELFRRDRFGTTPKPTTTTTTTTTTDSPLASTTEYLAETTRAALTTIIDTTTEQGQRLVEFCTNFVSSNVEQTAAKVQAFCENPDNQNSILQFPSGANSTAAEFCAEFMNQTAEAIEESINNTCGIEDNDKESGFDPRFFAILSVLALAGAAYLLTRNRGSATIAPEPTVTLDHSGGMVNEQMEVINMDVHDGEARLAETTIFAATPSPAPSPLGRGEPLRGAVIAEINF